MLLQHIKYALEKGLITDVQAKMLINLAERVSKGETTLLEFTSYIEANIDPKKVTITESPIRSWLQNAHELSVAGVTFDNRLTGETRVETSQDQKTLEEYIADMDLSEEFKEDFLKTAVIKSLKEQSKDGGIMLATDKVTEVVNAIRQNYGDTEADAVESMFDQINRDAGKERARRDKAKQVKTTDDMELETPISELEYRTDEEVNEDQLGEQAYAEKIKLDLLNDKESLRQQIAAESDATKKAEIQAELDIVIQETADLGEGLETFLAEERKAIENMGHDPDIVPLKSELDAIDAQLRVVSKAIHKTEAAKNLAKYQGGAITFIKFLVTDMKTEPDLFAEEGEVIDIKSEKISQDTLDSAKYYLEVMPELPSKVDTETKSKIPGTKKIKNVINNRLKKGKITKKLLQEIHAFHNFNALPHLEQQIDETSEAKKGDDLREQRQSLWKEYRQLLAQRWLTESKNNRELFLTINSLRQTVKQAQSIKQSLKNREAIWKKIKRDAKAENRSKFTFEEIVNIIYPNSKHWSKVRQNYMDNPEHFKDKTYTLREVEILYYNASQEALSYANGLKQGMSKYVLMPQNFDDFTKMFAHEVDEDYILELDTDIDDMAKKTKIGLTEAQNKKRDVLQEAMLLEKWISALRLLSSKWEGKEIPAFIIESTQPKEFDNLIEDSPLGIYSLLERHVIRTENNQDKNPLELSLEADKVFFDFDGVMNTVRIAMLRHHVALGKWSQALALESLESLESSIEDEGGKNSIYNVINTERVLERFSKAQTILTGALARDNGLVLKRDTNGFPILEDATEPQFLQQVKQAMKDRIITEAERTNERAVLHKINEMFPDWFSTVFEDMEVSREWSLAIYISDNIFKKLSANLDQFSPDAPFSIIELGNGVRDWQDATTVGEALVDVIIGKSLVMKNPLFTLDPEEAIKGELNEYSAHEHASVIVSLPAKGQTNRSAPVSPRDLFRNFQNYKYRKRIEAILNEDLTPAKQKKLWKWINEISKVLHPDKVGEELKFGILPTTVGGALHERQVPWDEMKQYYREHMLDIPQIGIGHIHDEATVAEGTFIQLKEEYRMQHPGASHGSSLLVPYGQIGDIMALEATWIGLDGMAAGSIAAVHTLAMSAPKRPDGLPDIYDPRNHVDRTFSGLMEARLLSLAGIGEGQTAKLIGVTGETIQIDIDELIAALHDGTWREKYKSEIDYYKAGGVYVASQIGIRYSKGDTVTRSKLNKINTIFSETLMDGNKYLTLETWNIKDASLREQIEKTTNIETEKKLKKQLKRLGLMRNFFKIPIMRRLYQGGMGSWNTEFNPNGFRRLVDKTENIQDSKLADGIKALAAIEEEYGVKFEAHEITALGESMFKESVNRMAILIQEQMNETSIDLINEGLVIDAALGMPKGTKGQMMAFLRMDAGGGRPIQNMVDGWIDKVRIWSENKKAGLDEVHPLYNATIHEEAWETAIDEITRLTYGITDKSPKWRWAKGEVMKIYGPRMEATRKYLRSLSPKERANFRPDSPQYKKMESIMYGGTDGAKGETGRKMYQSVGYFKALNAKNRTALEINIARMEQAAEYLGFDDFDRSDFMGLGRFIIYHTAMATVGSNRAYDLAAGYGSNIEGAFWERIAKDPNAIDPNSPTKDSIFHIEAQKKNTEVYNLTIDERREIIADYMLRDSDNLDALGMHDIKNNPYYGNKIDGTPKYTKESFDEEIEVLMLKNALIQYATYDKPPLESYTAEDIPGQIEEEWLNKWSVHTVGKEAGVVKEMAQEADWLRRMRKDEERYGMLLRMKAKTNRIFNPEVARALGVPLNTYAKREFSEDEIFGVKSGPLSDSPDTRGSVLTQQTANEIGPMSMQPRYKKVSFYDRGIFFLQLLQTRRLKKEVLGDLKLLKAVAEGKVPIEGLIDPIHFGYAKPWKRSTLPVAVGTEGDWVQMLDTSTPEGVEARLMFNEVHLWATNRGYWDIIETTPATFPYFFQLMQYEKIRKTTLDRMEWTDDYDFKAEHERINMIIRMHNTSYLSRDIKKGYRKGQQWSNKGRGIATPEGIRSMEKKIIKRGGKAATLEELLTSPVSENNPFGYTIDPTLVHDALDFGIVDREGITIEGTTIENDPYLWKFSDLHLVSTSIQARDFNGFVMAFLYNEYIQKIIHSMEDYKRLRKFAGNPNTWDTEFTLEEKQGLYEAAKAAAIADQIQIEFHVPANMIKFISKHSETHDLVRIDSLLKEGHVSITKRVDGTSIDITHGLRSTFYQQGFSLQTVAPREIRGGNVTMALSASAALEMVSLLENSADMKVLNLSYTLDKNIDTKLSDAKTQKMIRARTDSEYADLAFGHTMEEANRRTVLQSEAMNMIVRALGHDKALPNTFSKKNFIDGQPVDIVDLELFKASPHDQVSDIVTESFIAPIRAVMNRINKTGLSSLAIKSLNEIDSLIEAVKFDPTSEEYRTKLIILSAMFMQGNESMIDMDTINVIVDKNMLPSDPNKAQAILQVASDEAGNLYRAVAELAHPDHIYSNKPLMQFAREFAWKATDIEIKDNQTFRANWINKVLSDPYLSSLVPTSHINPLHGVIMTKEQMVKELITKFANTALDFALAHQSEDRHHYETEWFGDPNVKELDIVSMSRTHGKFMEVASSKNGSPYLKNVGQRINEMTQKRDGKPNYLSSNEAAILRAYVLRMHTYNPMSIADIAFDEEKLLNNLNLTDYGLIKHMTLGEAIREGKGKYKLLTSPELKGKHFRAMDVIMHELSHIATFKFIESNSTLYRKWQNLYRMDKGASYLTKMVEHFYGGKSAHTKQMVKYYMSHEKEYIAAMVQYSLLNDINGKINNKDWTAFDNEIHTQTKGLVGRITQFIRRSFGRLSSVFTAFAKDDPKLFKTYQLMVSRTLGWDPIAGQVISEAINPPWTKARYQGEKSFATSEKTMSDPEFMELMIEAQELTEISTQMGEDFDQREELARLEGLVSDHGMAEIEIGRMERRDYIRRLINIQNKYPAKVGGMFDLHRMMQDQANQQPDYEAAMQFVVDKLRAIIGDPMTANTALAAKKFLKAFPGLNPNTVKNMVIDFQVGPTGATRTWAGPTIFQRLFSALLDDRVVMTARQVDNRAGMPSVTRGLGVLEFVGQQMDAFDKILMTVASKVHAAEGKNKKANRQFIHQKLQREFIHKVDDPGYVPILPPDIKEADRKEAMKAILDGSKAMRLFLEDLVDQSEKIGLYGKGFTNLIPLRFNNYYTGDKNLSKSFEEIVRSIIYNKILSGASDQAVRGGFGQVDAATLYMSGQIPSVRSTQDMVNDMIRMTAAGAPAHQKGLVHHFMHKVLGPDGIDKLKKVAGGKEEIDTYIDNQIAQLSTIPGERTIAVADTIIDLFRAELISFIGELQIGNIKWSDIHAMSGYRKNWLSQYTQALESSLDEEVDPVLRDRLMDLSTENIGLPKHIFFKVEPGTTSSAVPQSGGKLNSVIDLHYHNLHGRANRGLYFPNNAWAIPNFSELASHPEADKITPAINTDPGFLVKQFKKSFGDEVIEFKMMRDSFGIHTDYNTMIELADKVFATEKINHPDGSSLSVAELTSLRNGIQTLMGKHDFIRGVQHHGGASDDFSELLVEMAPTLTKIAFGGNLATASLVVEGAFNALVEAVGMRSLTGSIRAILAGVLPLAPHLRKEFAGDLIAQIEAVTQGHIPDYQRPSRAIEEGWFKKGMHSWGRTMMYPAKHVLTGIAMSRAITIRRAITKIWTSEGLKNLNDYMMTNKVETQVELRDAMRTAKIPSKYAGIIKILIQGGLFTTAEGAGDFNQLDAMFKSYEINNESYYGLNTLLTKITTDKSTKLDDYGHKLRVLSKLRYAEKEFIEQVLISPNAFDITTPKRGHEMGTIDAIWEVFRRYPMLFSSQKFLRAGTEMSMPHFALQVLSLLILDSIYMLLLQIAAGTAFEEIMDRWEKDPKKEFATLFLRLPIMGRWLPLMGELLKHVSEGVPPNRQHLIPLSGLYQIMNNMLNAGKAGFGAIGVGDFEMDTDEWMNTIRNLPGFGDTITKLAVQLGKSSIAAEDRASSRSQESNMDQFRARGGNFGMTEGLRQQTPEWWIGQIMREVFGTTMKEDMRDNEMFKALSGRLAEPVEPTEGAPELPSEPPAEPSVAQSLDKDPITQLAAQKGVSSNLADRLSGEQWSGEGNIPWRGAEGGKKIGWEK
jgi:hypothetical protein